MNTKARFEPAFPCTTVPNAQDRAHGVQPRTFTGITLRDYLAAHSGVTFSDALAVFTGKGEPATGPQVIEMLATMKYLAADAMLKARES